MGTPLTAAPAQLITLDHDDNLCVSVTGTCHQMTFPRRNQSPAQIASGAAKFEVIAGPDFPSSCSVSIAPVGEPGLYLHLDASGATRLPAALKSVLRDGDAGCLPATVTINATNADGRRATLMIQPAATHRPTVVVALIDGTILDRNPAVAAVQLGAEQLHTIIPTLADTIAPLVANTRDTCIELRGTLPHRRLPSAGAGASDDPFDAQAKLVLRTSARTPAYCHATIIAADKPDLILRLDRPALTQCEDILTTVTANSINTREHRLVAADLRGRPVDITIRNGAVDGRLAVILTAYHHNSNATNAVALPHHTVANRLVPCIHNRIRPRIVPNHSAAIT